MIPYWYRFLALLALLAVIAGVDWWRKRQSATKWREYAALLLAGVLGIVIVTATIHLSASICPDYFIAGKPEVSGGTRFRKDVTELGFRVGFMVGLLIGGLLLLTNSLDPERPSLGYRRLARATVWPILGAALMAPAGALLVWLFDPLGLSPWVGEAIPQHAHGRFLIVWGLHAGAFLGGSLGHRMGGGCHPPGSESTDFRFLWYSGKAPLLRHQFWEYSTVDVLLGARRSRLTIASESVYYCHHAD